MRLLVVPDPDTGHAVPQLKEFPPDRIPKYAILSHVWARDSEEEVLFADMLQQDGDQRRIVQRKYGYRKVWYSCAQAIKDGLKYVWVRFLFMWSTATFPPLYLLM